MESCGSFGLLNGVYSTSLLQYNNVFINKDLIALYRELIIPKLYIINTYIQVKKLYIIRLTSSSNNLIVT